MNGNPGSMNGNPGSMNGSPGSMNGNLGSMNGALGHPFFGYFNIGRGPLAAAFALFRSF